MKVVIGPIAEEVVSTSRAPAVSDGSASRGEPTR